MSIDAAVVSLLASVSVRVAVVAALAWVVLSVCRVRRADVRHAVWSLVLAAMLAAPLLAWFAPSLTLHVGHPAAAPDAIPSRQVPLVVSAAAPDSPITPPNSPVSGRLQWNWQSVLCALYAAGALIMLGRLVYGCAMARRLVRSSKTIEEPLPTGIRVAECGCITVPVTIGWVRPRILLPVGWHEWSEGKLRAVLAHESTHVKRGDYLVGLLASLNRGLYWFHPLAWWLERALIASAEQACDDEAIVLTGNREQYAGALLDMAAAVRAGRGRLVWEAMAMARSNQVRHRIELVLDETRRLTPGLSKARWAALVLACVPLAYGAATVRFAQPEPPREPEVILQGAYLQNLVAGNRLTAAQAEEIEAHLKTDPEDLEARTKVVAYYFLNAIRQPRLNHILWLIEHHPENEVSCLYSMAILPRKSILNDEADFERTQTLWREQVRRHADSPQVLSNAADFFSSNGGDLELAIELYKRSRESSKPPATYLTGQKLTSLYSRILIASLKTGDAVNNYPSGNLVANDPFRNPVLAERIRREVESGSDTSLLMGVASNLRSIAVPAASYPAGRPHPLFREEHLELAPVFEYGDRLWKHAEDLGLIRRMLPPGTRTLAPTAPRNVSPAPVPKAAEPASKPMRIRVGANVQQAMLAKRVEPVYPPAAVEAQVTGVVTLSVILSTEGKVQQIQAMDGHPVLVPAAMEAVRQWEYKPTLLNDKPVEVATTIEVRFELPAQPKP